MDSVFTFIVADDAEHEMVFAEIYCNGKFIALVSQDEGPDRLMVEIPGPGLDENLITRKVVLTEFVAALDEAAKKLLGDG